MANWLSRPGFLDRLEGNSLMASGPGSVHPGVWEAWEKFYSGPESKLGISINADTAMRISAVYAAVRIIAESLASLPLILYRRREDGGKDRATDHPLYRLLHDKPNEDQTSFSYLETEMQSILLLGNSVSVKMFAGGKLVELVPVELSRVEIKRTRTGVIQYKITPRNDEDGREQTFTRDRIFHMAGMSSDGVAGRSVISDARESMGLSIAAEEHGARTMRHGAFMSGYFETPPGVTLKPENKKNFHDSWKEYEGYKNSGKTPLLEYGITFKPAAMTQRDAQFIEARKFQISEIARIFRLPLHMLAENITQPRANMEQAALEFVQNTLRPWAVRIEKTINDQLLGNDPELFVEFLLDALLRGDFEGRMNGYAKGSEWGIYSLNDCRRLENMDPLPPEIGDKHLRPMNMVIRGEEPPPQPQQAQAVPQ